MNKYYVFDTNVLLYDPDCIEKFQGENIFVVIPITVVEEIDKFKKEMTERGRNARQFSRNIEEIRKKGDISKGIKLENGSTLIIKIPEKTLADYGKNIFIGDEGDNRILATALQLKEKCCNSDRVIFLTKDINLRIKASALGLETRDYEERDIQKFGEHYQGWIEINVSSEIIDKIYINKKVNLSELALDEEIFANEFIFLKSEKNAALTIFNDKLKEIQLIDPKFKEQEFWGIKARNREQIFSLYLLLDDSIKLVSLVGKAGTGKTLLALAAGLTAVVDNKIYKKLIVSRPISPLGKDLGFLPGDVGAKLSPWMSPIYDNLDFLVGKGGDEYSYQYLIEKGIVELEPLTYIRGRSIANQYLIVDEAQNLTPHEIKTIITRAGEDTKIVLTGDPYQIDTPYLDSTNNGLVYVLEKFKGQSIAGTVTLTKGERSELAEVASNIL